MSNIHRVNEAASIAIASTNAYGRILDFAHLLASELDDKEAECLELRKRFKDSPTAQLNNICAAMNEHLGESPYTQEEWDRIDKENTALKAECEGLQEKLTATQEALDYLHGLTTDKVMGQQQDAERYRWLVEDHDDRETRAKCRELLDRLGMMSYSAASAAIDTARKS